MALHILTRFKLYKLAQSLAENLAFNMPEDGISPSICPRMKREISSFNALRNLPF
ncbi:hypothetical protein CCACVL1_01354, partial [Corchorus capsularis]